MKIEVNNKPQTAGTKNDKKNKQEAMPAIRIGKISESRQTAKVGMPSARTTGATLGRGLVPVDEPHPAAPAAASYAQQPNAQQNTGFQPKGDRYIRSWVEGLPDLQK